MPYKLRKAPKRELYWVVNIDTGKKHSIEPIPRDRAQRQMNLLRGIEHGFKPTRRLNAGSYAMMEYESSSDSSDSWSDSTSDDELEGGLTLKQSRAMNSAVKKAREMGYADYSAQMRAMVKKAIRDAK